MKKRLFTALLCMIMALSLLPAAALAEDDISCSKLDLSTPPTIKTTYKAGSGTVVWDPTATPATLTLDSARIELGSGSAEDFFILPDVPVKIELKGESTLSTSASKPGEGTVPNTANFFSAINSVELTGSGTINSTTSGYFIKAESSVTLTGGTHAGRIKAAAVTLNSITIPENDALDLAEVTGPVTAEDTINNGTLVLERAADSNADIAAIKALGITGSGMVKATAGTSNYYGNDGSLLNSLGGVMDFSQEPTAGNWSSEATVQDIGYKFSGNSTNGYTLELGNLIMETIDSLPCITLPHDGPVKVLLTEDTVARLINNGEGSAMLFKRDVSEYPCTITGKGRLSLTTHGASSIDARQPLTIEGGNITVKNYVGIGIDTNEAKLTIIGGMLNITANDMAIKAYTLELGSGVNVASPNNAAPGRPADCEYYTILYDGVPADTVSIQPAPFSGNEYTPSPVTVYNDPSLPNATVWLTGSGLSRDDLLITERKPSGIAYEKLKKLADSCDIFMTYNIYLNSGKKSTGSAMNMTFNLNAKYAGQDFTLVHQKADSTNEYFYDSADANGDLTFGPLYELSPFMLVKGTLKAGAVDIPQTDDSAQSALWIGAALLTAAASLAGIAICIRRRHKRHSAAQSLRNFAAMPQQP